MQNFVYAALMRPGCETGRTWWEWQLDSIAWFCLSEINLNEAAQYPPFPFVSLVLTVGTTIVSMPSTIDVALTVLCLYMRT